MKVAALTSEHRLRGPVGRRHLPALMAGLAGVRGSTDTSCPHLYCRRWASWPQLLARIPRFRPALALTLVPGLSGVPLADFVRRRVCRSSTTRVWAWSASARLMWWVSLLRIRFCWRRSFCSCPPPPLDKGIQPPPQPPRPHRAPLLARLPALIPRGPGCQAGHFRQRDSWGPGQELEVHPARTVGDLPHIPVQTQHSRGRAARAFLAATFRAQATLLAVAYGDFAVRARGRARVPSCRMRACRTCP